MAGFPFNTIRIPSDQILGIEQSPNISKVRKSSRMGAMPKLPQEFQINIVYAQGKNSAHRQCEQFRNTGDTFGQCTSLPNA